MDANQRRQLRELKRKRNKKRRIIFFSILIILAVTTAGFLVYQAQNKPEPIKPGEKYVAEFPGEPKNSLDMVYIGSDSVYSGWSPLQAFNDHGFTSYSYSIKDLSGHFIKDYIGEAREKQDPQLFVIDILPFINYDENSGVKEKVETKYKGFRLQKYNTKPLSSEEGISEIDDASKLDSNTKMLLDDVIEYAKEQSINLLFTYVPGPFTEEDKKAINAVEKYISDNEYELYDTIKHYEKMFMDFTSDFQDENYLNYIGASKYTDHFASYLRNKYEFQDKRDNKDYDSWSKDFEKYMDKVMEQVYSRDLADSDMLYTLRMVDANRANIAGLYAEEEDTIDMVYTGASSAFSAWSPLQAFEQYGFTSYTLGVRGTPASTYKNLIIEAEKTQNPKLHVIDISPFMQMTNTKEYIPDHLFRIVNGMKYSANRTKTIASFYKYTMPELSKEELEQYEFDVLLSKDNEDSLTEDSYKYSENEVENKWKGFKVKKAPATPQVMEPGARESKETTWIDPNTYTLLDELFEYSKQENVDMLFTYPPRLVTHETKAVFNTIGKYIEDNGFVFYDNMETYDKMGIDFNQHLIDKNHLNLYGAIIYTEFMGKYFKDNYDLSDKRKDDKYSSWHTLYDSYTEDVKKAKDKINSQS